MPLVDWFVRALRSTCEAGVEMRGESSCGYALRRGEMQCKAGLACSGNARLVVEESGVATPGLAKRARQICVRRREAWLGVVRPEKLDPETIGWSRQSVATPGLARPEKRGSSSALLCAAEPGWRGR
jgi:hypothetical protein